jgi:hypothetical protein
MSLLSWSQQKVSLLIWPQQKVSLLSWSQEKVSLLSWSQQKVLVSVCNGLRSLGIFPPMQLLETEAVSKMLRLIRLKTMGYAENNHVYSYVSPLETFALGSLNRYQIGFGPTALTNYTVLTCNIATGVNHHIYLIIALRGPHMSLNLLLRFPINRVLHFLRSVGLIKG